MTVVIPTFNRASAVEVALRSVQAQSYSDWEAIVVDDGSRDDTAGAVARLAREDGRISLIRHDRNHGARAARNTGIRNARGNWIALLDSDDEWLSHSLRLRLDAANTHQMHVVHSGAYRVCKYGSTTLHDVPPRQGRVYRASLRRPGPMFQGLLVTRDALERIDGVDERIVALQEWDTTLRLAKHYPFGFVATPTFIWDCRSTDTLTKDRRRDARGYAQVVRKHVSSMIRYCGPQVVAEPLFSRRDTIEWEIGLLPSAAGWFLPGVRLTIHYERRADFDNCLPLHHGRRPKSGNVWARIRHRCQKNGERAKILPRKLSHERAHGEEACVRPNVSNEPCR